CEQRLTEVIRAHDIVRLKGFAAVTGKVIDYQTFSSTASFARELLGSVGEFLIRFLGWNYDSEEALKTFRGKHVIVQWGDPEMSEVVHDGVISSAVALANGVNIGEGKVILTNSKTYPDFPPHGQPIDSATVKQIANKLVAADREESSGALRKDV
ncbi:MAG: hypothetical protein AAGE99_02480, partial [Chlamydiota bacterium]